MIYVRSLDNADTYFFDVEKRKLWQITVKIKKPKKLMSNIWQVVAFCS